MNKYLCICTYFREKSKINSLLKVHCDNKHQSKKISFRKSTTYILIVTFDPREKSRASNLDIITYVGSSHNPFFRKTYQNLQTCFNKNRKKKHLSFLRHQFSNSFFFILHFFAASTFLLLIPYRLLTFLLSQLNPFLYCK